MAKRNTYQALLLGAVSALTLALLAGCAPHASAPAAPAGMQAGQPLTPAQVQAVYQQKAAHKAVSAP